jgi:hypothetical protein
MCLLVRWEQRVPRLCTSVPVAKTLILVGEAAVETGDAPAW